MRTIVHYNDPQKESLAGNATLHEASEAVDLVQLFGARNPSGRPLKVTFAGNHYVLEELTMEIEQTGETVHINLNFMSWEEAKKLEEESKAQQASFLNQLKTAMPAVDADGGDAEDFDLDSLGINFDVDDGEVN